MDESLVIRKISFPKIPDDASDSMKVYLRELEVVLEDALRGSLLLENTLEDGKIGN